MAWTAQQIAGLYESDLRAAHRSRPRNAGLAPTRRENFDKLENPRQVASILEGRSLEGGVK